MAEAQKVSRTQEIRNDKFPHHRGCHQQSAIAGTYNVDAVHSTIGFVAVTSCLQGPRSIHRVHRCDHHWRHARELQCEATVQAASITTDNEMRDAHLKSPDFLEFETYPT